MFLNQLLQKDDKPAELETPEEKSQNESYTTACDQLRKKIEGNYNTIK